MNLSRGRSRVREEVGLEGNVEEGRATEKKGPVKKSRIIQTEGKPKCAVKAQRGFKVKKKKKSTMSNVLLGSQRRKMERDFGLGCYLRIISIKWCGRERLSSRCCEISGSKCEHVFHNVCD